MEKSLQDHFKRIKDRLSKGRGIMESLANQEHTTFDAVPRAVPQRETWVKPPSLETDPYVDLHWRLKGSGERVDSVPKKKKRRLAE